jgi:hypothetical protein
MGDPTSRYAAAGIALRVSGALEPPPTIGGDYYYYYYFFNLRNTLFTGKRNTFFRL